MDEDYLYTRQDSASLDPDHITIIDQTLLEIKRMFSDVCPGDTVIVSFETAVMSIMSKPMFIGGFIEYGDSTTLIEVSWSPGDYIDRYSGTAKAKSPKGYKENVFAVTVRYSFEGADYYEDLAFLTLNLEYLKISAGYYKSIE